MVDEHARSPFDFILCARACSICRQNVRITTKKEVAVAEKEVAEAKKEVALAKKKVAVAEEKVKNAEKNDPQLLRWMKIRDLVQERYRLALQAQQMAQEVYNAALARAGLLKARTLHTLNVFDLSDFDQLLIEHLLSMAQ